jgi:Na+/proline symporter
MARAAARSGFFQWMWLYMPKVLGAWVMIAIIAASMSTATGAILATSTVMANNIWRKLPKVRAHWRGAALLPLQRAPAAPAGTCQ